LPRRNSGSITFIEGGSAVIEIRPEGDYDYHCVPVRQRILLVSVETAEANEGSRKTSREEEVPNFPADKLLA